MSSSYRVLVIDDEPDARRAMAAQLDAMGHVSEAASEGVSAPSKAKTFRPDVVLLDLGLPGSDGSEVLTRLKSVAQTAAVPVVVVTGRTSADSRARALRLGATEFLAKPLDPEQLGVVLHACVTSKGCSRAA